MDPIVEFITKAKARKILRIKFQLRESKSLEMSILRATFTLKLLFPNRFIASYVRQIPFFMFLPAMNPCYSGEIIEGRMEANMSTKILEISLYLKLAIAIGLYCPMLLASLDLGIITKVLALKLGRIRPCRMVYSIYNIHLCYIPVFDIEYGPKSIRTRDRVHIQI